jgi:hypothetical protein
MKLLSAIAGVLLGAMIGTSLQAQVNGCYLKKSYRANEGFKLAVMNKFGDINILTTNKDSLFICATINIEQEDKSLSSKSLDLINLNIIDSNDSIAVSTKYDKDFFTPKYSKGRKSFRVDYTIQLPVYANIYLTNSFGNISIEDCSGYLNLKLSQGLLLIKNLSRGNVKPFNSVTVFNTDVNIIKANWLSLNLRNCQSVKIGDVQALLISSEVSKINIEKVNSLVAESKSDNYQINSISNMDSESTYSSFTIESCGGILSSKSVLGSLSVAKLRKDFNSLNITATHSLVDIQTEEGISFNTDISATNNPVEFAFDEDPGINRTVNNLLVTIKGVAGENKQTNSLMKITTTLGKLVIK